MMMINFLVVWLTNKIRLALFPAGTVIRDPHHYESPTRLEQGLNLRSSDNHYTTAQFDLIYITSFT